MIVQQALRRAANPFLTLLNGRCWRDIESRRATLLACDDVVEDTDYGAGDPNTPRPAATQQKGVSGVLRVREAAAFSKPRRQGRMLYYLTREKRPGDVLELGTCVGISASYIAAALKQNRRGHLWTIEGSPHIADIAVQTLSLLGFASVASVLRGPFHETLEPALMGRRFDLVFVDGHHDGTATVGYFSRIKPHLSPGAVVLFDDIAWSDGMRNAWRRISSDPSIGETMTDAGIGFAVMKA